MDRDFIQKLIHLLQSAPDESVAALVLRTPGGQSCVLPSNADLDPEELAELLEDGLFTVDPNSALEHLGEDEPDVTLESPSTGLDRTPKH